MGKSELTGGKLRGEEPKGEKVLTSVLFTVYILLLVGIIIFKLPFRSDYSDKIRVINLIPFQGSYNRIVASALWEIAENVLLFTPLGIYLCMLKWKMPLSKKLRVIITLSLSFEVIQYIFAIGRSDITDVINNTFGGIIGIGIYSILSKLLGANAVKTVNRLALVVTVLFLLYFSYLLYLSHYVMSPHSLMPDLW